MIEISWQQLVALALFLGFGGFIVWGFLKYGGDTTTYYSKNDQQYIKPKQETNINKVPKEMRDVFQDEK